jgi:hypothetical protein
MRKRASLLDSRNWTPLTEVHRFVCEQTGDRRLAARDLTDAMANGRVRSMRRGMDPPRRADEPERELLPPSFWATEYRLNSWSDKLRVVERKGYLPLRPPRKSLEPVPGPLRHGYVYFAWKPDWKKIGSPMLHPLRRARQHRKWP